MNLVTREVALEPASKGASGLVDLRISSVEIGISRATAHSGHPKHQPGNNSKLPCGPKTPVSRLKAVRGCYIIYNLAHDREFAICELWLP